MDDKHKIASALHKFSTEPKDVEYKIGSIEQQLLSDGLIRGREHKGLGSSVIRLGQATITAKGIEFRKSVGLLSRCWHRVKELGRSAVYRWGVGLVFFAAISVLIWTLFGHKPGRESHIYPVFGCDNPNRVADIVFVHGLDGHHKSTWHPKGKPTDYFPRWLGEDLTEKGKPPVGVWSFDYPAAKLKAAGHTMPIPSRAKNLLGQLDDSEIGADRPLIFVTHSLGGLVVKKALDDSARGFDDELSYVARNTRGVVFLATPHSGSGVASVLNFLANRLTSTTVAELESSNPYLIDLNKSYQRNADDFRIATLALAETKGPGGILVVNEASADPNIPGVTVRPMDADHLTICKPVARDRGAYPAVRNFVQDVITRREGGAAALTPDETQATLKLIDKLLESGKTVSGALNETGMTVGEGLPLLARMLEQGETKTIRRRSANAIRLIAGNYWNKRRASEVSLPAPPRGWKRAKAALLWYLNKTKQPLGDDVHGQMEATHALHYFSFEEGGVELLQEMALDAERSVQVRLTAITGLAEATNTDHLNAEYISKLSAVKKDPLLRPYGLVLDDMLRNKRVPSKEVLEMLEVDSDEGMHAATALALANEMLPAVVERVDFLLEKINKSKSDGDAATWLKTFAGNRSDSIVKARERHAEQATLRLPKYEIANLLQSTNAYGNAVQSLKKDGMTAIPVVTELLRNDNHRVRMGAAQATQGIIESRLRSNTPADKKELESEGVKECLQALMEAIDNFKPESAQKQKMLDSHTLCINALSAFGFKEGVPDRMLDLALDMSRAKQVRWIAYLGLKKFGTRFKPQATDKLRGATGDDKPYALVLLATYRGDETPNKELLELLSPNSQNAVHTALAIAATKLAGPVADRMDYLVQLGAKQSKNLWMKNSCNTLIKHGYVKVAHELGMKQLITRDGKLIE